MKSGKNKLALAAVIGVMTLVAVPQEASASVHAGMSAVLADYLHQSEGLVIAKSDVSVSRAAALEETAADEKEVASEKSEKKAAEEKDEKFCGYTNLGLANVDNYLNVRKEPGENAELVGKMPAGAGCEVYDKEDGWYRIRSGKVEGYVSADFLLTGDKAKKKAKDYIKEVATVTTTTLFVREKPNTDCAVITMVPIEEELTVLKKVDDGAWYKIEIDDEEGYVSGDYVEISQKLPKAMTISEVKYGQGVSNVRVDLVQYALQFVGNPYVWGGTSLTRGVDCSGFTMQVYAKYGVYLPHSSRAQPACGRRISAGEAQPGDLFFYGSGGSINHVAIYIGGGQVVHASNHRDGIKISNAYYRTPICVVSYL
ncbi:MAG: SH3 domain-containing C40 family peptidase [Lachnospiraceae bacterium]|nr:SH3 domain-containing C40 family peptidase [bacterium]MDY5518368.1 SH3 domain-containing C40 family peptidase [Lachnospiraceae bacterium]